MPDPAPTLTPAVEALPKLPEYFELIIDEVDFTIPDVSEADLNEALLSTKNASDVALSESD